MVTYASAHLPSHPHAENRSPNDDEGAKIGHFMCTRPCVTQVMHLRFRCDESVYESVSGRHKHPRAYQMPCMDRVII